MNYYKEYSVNNQKTIIKSSKQEISFCSPEIIHEKTVSKESIVKIDRYYENNLPYNSNQELFHHNMNQQQGSVLPTKIFLPPIKKKKRFHFFTKQPETFLGRRKPTYLSCKKKKKLNFKVSFFQKKKNNRIFPYLKQRTCSPKITRQMRDRMEGKGRKRKKISKFIKKRYVMSALKNKRKYKFGNKFGRSQRDVYLDECLKPNKGNEKVRKIVNIVREVQNIRDKCSRSTNRVRSANIPLIIPQMFQL